MQVLETKKNMALTFKIEKDGNKFHAFCLELVGCHTFGKTPAEALKNLKEAIALYLDDELESQTIDDLIQGKNV